ncbi:hypothetical protein M758_UG071900 [Ceratodon purpureus]|nr:hypothetical protein M758_UG071900 [Ceratodon purpureus]
MLGCIGPAPPVNSSIFVCNIPPGTSATLLADHFGKIGLVKKDRTSGAPLIWFNYDKHTHELNGDATLAFENPHAAAAAVKWYNNTEFNGNIISVLPIEGVEPLNFIATSVTIGYPSTPSVPEHEPNLNVADETYGSHSGEDGAHLEGVRGPADLESGRRRGRVDGRAWQQEGDWECPNSSCVNINFAFRGVCNRCGTARPSESKASGGGVTGDGRGRSRGATEAGNRGRGSGEPLGLFGPNDWNCPMCGNINWAKRLKCNICNTSKTGYTEGGAREGRAGGFKEFDEAEIEETKRRRREKEEDDGEMYDEFGTLKKKFRTKAKLGSALSFAVSATGVGKADLDDNIVGVDGYSREKSKDPSAYSLSSNPHENDKRCGHMDMKNSQLGRREHRHKGRGSKRTRGDF